MRQFIEKCDYCLVMALRHHGDEFGRFAIFVIFAWFGILKVFQVGPADALVGDLLEVTFLGFIPPVTFLIFFGVFEVILGIIALIPKLERIAFVLLGFHLITTVMPLFLLPEHTWMGLFVPTLIGQYIMKNMALLAVSFLLFARLRPMTETHHLMAEDAEKFE